MPASTIFINVFNFTGKDVAEGEVFTDRAKAAEDAESYADDYQYTLTDTGKLDLTSDFSEGYHEKKDFDATVDAKIDTYKEAHR